MDPHETEALVQRLVQDPHDQDAITYAHQAGQSDPRAYAQLLEKVGTATSDPAVASHWLTEAANVWSTTLADTTRAARTLMIAIERDPMQPVPAERLAELYREKGDAKAVVALLEKRAKALGTLAYENPEARVQVAGIHEELGRTWSDAPLSQPARAIENYRRAIEYEPTSIYAVYAIRELHKALAQWAEAIPYFAMEQSLVEDPERKLALFHDEAEVCQQAGDLAGMTRALRQARALEGGADPGLKQQLATAILERARAGLPVDSSELAEGTALFLELAETYPGEHGYAYSVCSLELDPGNDRGIQLAMYYGAQLARSDEVASRAAAYLRANPQGPMAADAAEMAGSAQPAPSAGAYAMAGGAVSPTGYAASDGSGPLRSQDRIREMLDEAEQLTRRGRKNDAVKLYREVLDLEPGNFEAVGFLEGYLRQIRKFAELKDILFAATRVPSVDEEARRTWLREVAGLCETQLRDMDSAIDAWRTLVSLDPTEEAPRHQLRRLLEKAQRWDDLAVLLEQEAQEENDIEVRISIEKALAKIHEQKRKDLVATGETWARIVNLVPVDENGLITAVRFLEKGGRPDLAAQVISENLERLEDEHHRVQFGKKLGELRQVVGDPLGAGEAYGEAASLSKDSKLWEAAEKAFVRGEVWDQAAAAIEARAQLMTVPKQQAQLFALEAEYLARAGDEASAVLKLEQATELDPINDQYAQALEQRYLDAGRVEALASFLLKRADHLPSKERRVELRKRAAAVQRDQMGDLDGARDSLLAVLLEGDDIEALELLVEDAEGRRAFAEAVDFLGRLMRTVTDRGRKLLALLREARLVADGLEDVPAAIERYERVLTEFDPVSVDALEALVDLHERQENPVGQAETLERLLALASDPTQKLELAQRLSVLYEEQLQDAPNGVRVLKLIRELDKEDFDALARLCSLSEQLEDWPRVAEYTASLLELEGDEREISRMTRRLAEILSDKLDKGDEALAVLVEIADGGDDDCRAEYVKLGDALGWKGIVATKLVEWNMDAPAGPERNDALYGAFERFVTVERFADAAKVAMELGRVRGADGELAKKLEEIAVNLKDLEALSVAHDLLLQELNGPARAEETVRQGQVLIQAGVDPAEAIQHGEQSLTSVPPAEVEDLLVRLAALAPSPNQVIDVYERQVTRCKSPSDRLHALARAAQMACEHESLERARGFFDLALGGGTQEDVLGSLEYMAREWDEVHSETKLRQLLCQVFASGGQGARDGGRTRGALLLRAAHLVHSELGNIDQAFDWLGDALVAHVDDAALDALEGLALEIKEPKRAEKALDRALEEVYDGPLVRRLLARRATLRAEQLDDRQGAAVDLKRLHELSPSDTEVTEQLLALYTELADHRGMVQLYEDQILRGKDQNVRAELARKVARLWEEQLRDPREAADAWRRVLRMRTGDPEATAGLERAKQNMLKKPSDLSSEASGLLRPVSTEDASSPDTVSESIDSDRPEPESAKSPASPVATGGVQPTPSAAPSGSRKPPPAPPPPTPGGGARSGPPSPPSSGASGSVR
ncbi:hypothetical protein ACFL5O_07695, partial [Myxococcota bacterium]